MLKAVLDLAMRDRTVTSVSIVRAGLCVLIMISGLALRGFGPGLGLPLFLVKYGGSLLWGAMVFFLVAVAAPRLSWWRIAVISASIAIAMELFRLVHAPWLDAFRMTLAGALLLGRIFSPWNLLAYGAGIFFGVLLDRWAIQAFARTGGDRTQQVSGA